ncbi:MAG: porin [Pirellulales bacterium]
MGTSDLLAAISKVHLTCGVLKCKYPWQVHVEAFKEFDFMVWNMASRTLFILLAFASIVMYKSELLGQDAFRLPSTPDGLEVVPATYRGDSPLSLEEVALELEKTRARLNALETGGQELADSQAATYSMVDELAKDLEKKESDKAKKEKKWYEKYTVRGYAQFRYNQILDESPGSAPAQHVGDSSVGENQSFLIRRARLIFSGDMNDHVSVYLQPDFASTPNGSVDAIQFVQIRDWYADLHLDVTKVHRIRVGQSKIPYGWENLQSSSNRLPLDRSDSLNSAVRNERDLGAFYYWTPEYAQKLFKYVLDEGLKGSGNYGVFGLGVYNGQGGSLRETNDDLHVVSRLTIPWQWENGQVTEIGVQGYTGMYSVYGTRIRPPSAPAANFPIGTIDAGNTRGIIDKRIAGTLIYYPQPLGFQAEWTVGRGPALNDAQTEVIDRALYGGYVMSMYRHQTDCYGDFFPFVRWNYFKGGYRSERNAPFAEINEFETGIEWQISKYVEFVGMYTLTNRTNTRDAHTDSTLSYNQFDGQLLRFQLQVNY